MSIWLSGANALAGSVRGHALARGRREAAAATTRATQDAIDLWTGALLAPPKPRKTQRRRKSRSTR